METVRDMGFVNVLGMPTSVLKFGKILPDTKSMFLVVPGLFTFCVVVVAYLLTC